MLRVCCDDKKNVISMLNSCRMSEETEAREKKNEAMGEVYFPGKSPL